ncbi:MAG: DUF47 family protein [Magnetococcales bacterium]|nr:DUF47 family protein [Magnetococcales bacterium]MBF0437713.1 DUF47 family protein [Magnetococcales bacterium]
MSGSSTTFSKLTNRVFPRMPNFYGLILEQCELANQAAALLEEYVQTGNKSRADQIAKLEVDAEAMRQRNLDVLKNAFATPMDREDIYRAYTTVDCIINYANNIVSEMAALNIKTDKPITEMVAALRNAVETLGSGYKKLASSPAEADKDAQLVTQARKQIEKTFRAALAQLFQGDAFVKKMQDKQAGAEAEAMEYVLDIFKRREIYRHLFDAAIDMKNAGKVLHDIVIQVA